MSRRTLWAVLSFACLAASSGLGAERMTILMTLDSGKIGPAVACDGQFRVAGGGQVTLREWCQDHEDAVEGAAYSLTSLHNESTAKKAKLGAVYKTTLLKGLLLEIDAHPQSTLEAITRLGNFEVPLDGLRRKRSIEVLDGKVRLQWVPTVAALTGDQAEEEYPSVTVLPDGRTAVAYVAWDGKKDNVFLRLGDEVRRVTPQPGDYLEPRCAVDGGGNLRVVWAANDGRQWDLWMDGAGGPVRLTAGTRNDFWPRLARDAKGRLWMAWQTVADDLHYEVMLAQLGVDGLSEAVNVSQHAADDWEPALSTTRDGRVAVAWDTYRNGSFDIYLRQFTVGPDGRLQALKDAVPVAATAKREAHATIASDSTGRLWLAWDVSFEDWGKHPEPQGTLHSERSSQVACLADGRLQQPAAELMASLPAPFGRFVEYPQVVVDGRDRVWVLFRTENQVQPFYVKRNAQRYGMWHLFATQFDGRRWTEPVMLARSNGRQDIRVDVALDPQGEPVVAYGADGRIARFPYMPVDYDVFLASLAGFAVPTSEMALAEARELGKITPARPDPELQPLPRQWKVGAKNYRLVIGDTHRHTDISRCSNGYDGSLQDAYRYALDCSGLDWLAISDHDQDILKHRNDRNQRPRQDYDWWRSQKNCDLYTIPGRFVALYGYEHGGSYQARGGHKNVVAADRYPVQEVDEPHALFAALGDSGAVAIPHQLADGGSRTDWDKWDSKFERVAEIFQTRGSYEFEGCPRSPQVYTQGHSMWDALARGIRIGIIASSDHGQTHQARAGVYVEDPAGDGDSAASGFTRDGILAGLRARRAFGATVAAALHVRIGDQPLGQEITVVEPPRIDAKLAAGAPIQRLDVVRDNRFVYTSTPQAAEASLSFHDIDLKPGQSAYYYVRAQIGENDFAWSSPLWVTRRE